MNNSIALPHRNRDTVAINRFLRGLVALFMLATVGWLQEQLDHRQDQTIVQIESLAQLPKGEYLKPALLGYHHLGADIIWLRLIQIIGKKKNSADEYEWMHHALNVITTLDPQYAFAYYTGGVILGDLANRPDLATQLLERGVAENPTVWNIPFLLGYNYYFLMADPANGAHYIMKAAVLPGRPAYLPGLATRLAVEAGRPETALAFLEARLQDTSDPEMREFLVNRMKEVIIERDITQLAHAVERYRTAYGKFPTSLAGLIDGRILQTLPLEPFGGEYRLDMTTGVVSSSTHPERLKTFFTRKKDSTYLYPKPEQSAYAFPKTW